VLSRAVEIGRCLLDGGSVFGCSQLIDQTADFEPVLRPVLNRPVGGTLLWGVEQICSEDLALQSGCSGTQMIGS
jgi:hypothetical protein